MQWIVLVSTILPVAFVVALYNRLVTVRNRYKNAFAQIDMQLAHRCDLIPRTCSRWPSATSGTSATR